MSDKQWSIVKWSAIAVVAAVIVGVPLLPGRTVPVTRDRLAAARRLWDKASITHYSMDLHVSGAQNGRYHVDVENGRVTRLTLDDQPADSNAPEYFTIDGLFQTLEEYLDHCENPETGVFPEGSKIWLRMRTHPTLGYPVRFIKQVKLPGAQSATGYTAATATQGIELRVDRLEPRHERQNGG